MTTPTPTPFTWCGWPMLAIRDGQSWRVYCLRRPGDACLILPSQAVIDSAGVALAQGHLPHEIDGIGYREELPL